MVGMSTPFIASQHPRGTGGRFIDKIDRAPADELTEAAVVYEQDAHKLREADYEEWAAAQEEIAYQEWLDSSEQWAADVAAGAVAEPDPEAGTREAWVSGPAPF